MYGLHCLCIELRLVTKVKNELYIILMQKLYMMYFMNFLENPDGIEVAVLIGLNCDLVGKCV